MRIRSALLLLLFLSATSNAQEGPESRSGVRDRLLAQRRKFEALVAEAAARSGPLSAAQRTLTQAVAAWQPVNDRDEALARKLGALDAYTARLALPARIDEQLIQFRKYHAFCIEELRTGRIPPGMTRKFLKAHAADIALQIQQAEAKRAKLLETLPTLSPPSFLPVGKTVAGHRAELVAKRRAIAPELGRLDGARQAAIRNLREELARAGQLDRTANRARQAYLKTLFDLGCRYPPCYLLDVRVFSYFDPDAKEALGYRAYWKDPPELKIIDGKIALLVTQLPALEKRVGETRKLFEKTEASFVDVAGRWQEKNRRYRELLNDEYALNALLELFDVAAGMWNGGGTPAGLLFEVGYRSFEATNPGKFRISDPPLSADILALRKRLSKQLTPRAGPRAGSPDDAAQLRYAAEQRAADAAMFDSLSGRVAKHLKKSQAGAGIKGLVSTGFGLVAEQMAERALRGGESASFAGEMARAMTASLLHPEMKLEQWEKLVETSGFAPGLDAVENAIRGGTPDRGTGLLGKLRDSEAYKKIGKSLLFGAAVTAAKEFPKAWSQNRRARAVAEMAVLDIEWLTRRAEFHAASTLKWRAEKALREVEATIGKLFAERYGEARRRKLEIVKNKPFAAGDALKIVLMCSAPVAEAGLRLGDRQLDVEVEGSIVTAKLPAGSPTEGIETMSFSARPVDGGPGSYLDGRPATVSRYRLDGGTDATTAGMLVDHETGPDTTHRISRVRPTLELLRPKSGGYLPGDWLDVKLSLVASLVRRRLTLIPMPHHGVDPTEIRGQPAGPLQIPVPNQPGDYRLVLHDESGPKGVLAEQAFRVVAPAMRPIAKAPFARILAGPLSDRGDRLRRSKDPVKAGLGRLYFDARDAGAQVTPAITRVRAAGSEKEISQRYGGAFVDLPAGAYDVLFEYPVPVTRKGVKVEAGSVTDVRVDGMGRFRFQTLDALGKPWPFFVRIHRAGSKKELTYRTGGRSVDLPPGKYDLFIQYVVPVELKSVPISSGELTLVRASGYGRLALKGTNSAGDPAIVYLRAPGAKEMIQDLSSGNHVDLPPGRWEIVFRRSGEEQVVAATVRAGKVTTVTVRTD